VNEEIVETERGAGDCRRSPRKRPPLRNNAGQRRKSRPESREKEESGAQEKSQKIETQEGAAKKKAKKEVKKGKEA